VEIVPCHSSHPLAQRPGTPLAVKSHSSRVSHSPSTQAPPSFALVLLWLVGSFFTCTEIFIPSLPFTALSRAGVNFTSLHSLLLPTLFRIHFSIRPVNSFLTQQPPDSNSCSISPWPQEFPCRYRPYRCTSSVRSFNLDSSLYLITNLVPYLQFYFELLVHALRLQSPRHKLSQIDNIPRDSFRITIGILPIVCTFPISAAPGCCGT
jgi:hypothetical protein